MALREELGIPVRLVGVGEGLDLARVQAHGLAVRGGRLHAEEVLVELGDHGQPQTRPRWSRHQGRHVGQIHAPGTRSPGQPRSLDGPAPTTGAPRADPGFDLEDEAQPTGAGLHHPQPGAGRGGGGLRRQGAGNAHRGEDEQGSRAKGHGRGRDLIVSAWETRACPGAKVRAPGPASQPATPGVEASVGGDLRGGGDPPTATRPAQPPARN